MPALDSHFGGANYNTYANARILPGFSTDTSNEVVGVAIFMTPETGSTPPTVTSISDSAGLTWTKRSRITNGTRVLEYWTAPTGGVLSSDVISVFFDMTCIGGILVFAVTGLADITDPFDSNASVPGFVNPGTGTTTATPPVTTNQARTLVIELGGCYGNGSAPTIGTPFAINQNNHDTFGTIMIASAVKNQQVVNLQAVFALNGTDPCIVVSDAFKGPGWLRYDTFVGGV